MILTVQVPQLTILCATDQCIEQRRDDDTSAHQMLSKRIPIVLEFCDGATGSNLVDDGCFVWFTSSHEDSEKPKKEVDNKKFYELLGVEEDACWKTILVE
eukprot:3903001-Amphidinium_carterae.1